MAMLVSRIATTFAKDTVALITGFGRLALRVVTAPAERIANACNVAGHATSGMWCARSNRKASPKRRGGLFRCLSFRYLSDLT